MYISTACSYVLYILYYDQIATIIMIIKTSLSQGDKITCTTILAESANIYSPACPIVLSNFMATEKVSCTVD